MSDQRRLRYNASERLLTDDLNAGSDLAAKLTLDLAWSVGAADVNAPSQTVGGVQTGLLISVSGADLTVQVSAGRALVYDPASAGTYDSVWRIIEQIASSSIDLTSLVNVGNPRWVCIEIAPGDEVESSSLREVYNTTTGASAPQTLVKLRRPAPVITATAGAAAATPVLPAGVAGRIPLGYVYVPAAAATLATGDVLRTRPIINRAGGSEFVSHGGGHDVTAFGDTAFRPKNFRQSPQYCGFELFCGFAGLTQPDIAKAGNPNWSVGQTFAALAGATRPIYTYLSTAPYPQGYTNIACREFYPVDQAAMALRIPSYYEGITNGILVLSTTAPTTADTIAPLDANAFVNGINDPVWGGGPGTSALAQMRHAYMGALTYATGSVGLAGQTAEGCEVRFIGSTGWLAETDTKNTASVLASLLNLRYTLPLTLGGYVWAPVGSDYFHFSVAFESAGAPAGLALLQFEDPGAVANMTIWVASVAEENTRTLINCLTTAGNLRFSHVNTAGPDSLLKVQVLGYRDPYLIRR